MDLADGRGGACWRGPARVGRTYLLTESDARALIDHQIEVIQREWHDVCDIAQMTEVNRSLFWGRQFLNRYAFEGYSAAPV